MKAPYPMLWFTSEAEDAVRLYTSVFPDSQVLQVQPNTGGAPGTPQGRR